MLVCGVQVDLETRVFGAHDSYRKFSRLSLECRTSRPSANNLRLAHVQLADRPLLRGEQTMSLTTHFPSAAKIQQLVLRTVGSTLDDGYSRARRREGVDPEAARSPPSGREGSPEGIGAAWSGRRVKHCSQNSVRRPQKRPRISGGREVAVGSI